MFTQSIIGEMNSYNLRLREHLVPDDREQVLFYGVAILTPP